MSSESSRKRGGEKLDNEPADKIQAVSEPTQNPDHVVLVVGREKFICSKKKLADHSEYFKKMFFADFSEKNEKEVQLGVVTAQQFQLFLDAIDNNSSVNDINVESALFAAGFLLSSTLENVCLEYLGRSSDYSPQEQLQLAENTNSKNLVIQLCDSLRGVWELNELLPTKLGTLSKPVLEIALQRSMEFHGYRKPQPTFESPEKRLEHMVNRIIDQAEHIHNHGLALFDQLFLLESDVISNVLHVLQMNGCAQDVINNDLEIKELMEKCQSARDLMEQNYYQTQAQVLKLKHMFTALENADPDVIRFGKESHITRIRAHLTYLPEVIDRNKQYRAGARELALGNRPIDQLYRDFVADPENQAERPEGFGNTPGWIQGIKIRCNKFLRSPLYAQAMENTTLPDGIRQVSNEANFTALDTVIRGIRLSYYSSFSRMQEQQQNQNQN